MSASSEIPDLLNTLPASKDWSGSRINDHYPLRPIWACQPVKSRNDRRRLPWHQPHPTACVANSLFALAHLALVEVEAEARFFRRGPGGGGKKRRMLVVGGDVDH